MEEQRTKEWFDKRKGKVSGSVAGAILGLAPYMTRADVLRSMVRSSWDAESEFKGNVATDYGNKFEPFAQADFELETGLDVVETGFHIHPLLEWIGASPDGLIGDDTVLEIKCPYSKRNGGEFKPLHEQPHYYAQVQIEMFVTGRAMAYFYQWSPQGSLLEKVVYNEGWIDLNLPLLREFYELYLSEKNNQEHLMPLVAKRTADDLAARFFELKKLIDDSSSELSDIKKELIEMADGKKSDISGVTVYPVKRKGSVSYSKVVKDHLPDLDLSEYTGESTVSWVVK